MIYHITTESLWEKALSDGKDKGSYAHPTLKTEGFIHCSTEAQLQETLRLHFAEVADVVVLKINERKLGAKLKWEASRNGELFPHIYGRVPLEIVQDIVLMARQADGSWA